MFSQVKDVVVYLLSCVQCIDFSPPGSSVSGISQGRILEWVAISFLRGSSLSRDWTHDFCTGRQILYPWATFCLSFWRVLYIISFIWLFLKKKTDLLYLSLRNLYFAQLQLSHWGYKKDKRRPPIFNGVIVKMNPAHKMMQLKLNEIILVKCSALCPACNKCSKKCYPLLSLFLPCTDALGQMTHVPGVCW